jgi:hypothetical protein
MTGDLDRFERLSLELKTWMLLRNGEIALAKLVTSGAPSDEIEQLKRTLDSTREIYRRGLREIVLAEEEVSQ